MAKPADFDLNVFINCPFDPAYIPIFDAIVFTVIACGYKVFSAQQDRDAGTIRVDKIQELIKKCRIGIHDISRTDLDPSVNLPRFNMPFELGLDIGARFYGKGHLADKRILIFDTEAYRYQKFLSDISGQDISIHEDSYETAIGKVRALFNSLRADGAPLLMGQAKLKKYFDQCKADLPAMCAGVGVEEQELDFNDKVALFTEWVSLVI